ncbi:hypothetical protein D3C77_720030 [compost metagenome]
MEQQLKPDKEYDLIAYNALKLDKQEVGTYLKEKLEKFKVDGIRSVSTSMRRLLTIYDFIENK